MRVASLLLLIAPLTVMAGTPDQDAPPPYETSVRSVYDGDTVTLATGDKVRMAAINTPEIKPLEEYAIEAREATRAFIEGRSVTLGYGSLFRDSYGRLLAEVFVDGRSASVNLLEQGLAHVFLIPPTERDTSPYFAAQERARLANRGLWSLEEYQGTLHVTSFHANADGDDRANVNGEYLRVCNISDADVDIRGYSIMDSAGNRYMFPAMVIPRGNTVKVHSGIGEHQIDPTKQLKIYLGSPTPIWNNDRDQATIYDRFGEVVDTRLHETKYAER